MGLCYSHEKSYREHTGPTQNTQHYQYDESKSMKPVKSVSISEPEVVYVNIEHEEPQYRPTRPARLNFFRESSSNYSNDYTETEIMTETITETIVIETVDDRSNSSRDSDDKIL